eukprot:NODE_198_length_2799_cov_16.376727_g181_i0.p1 GENE.NODE_198_length_2799_cov_16.376727_g181_i0~~NODE_198_length_2799_cov_16.376727_g181_i0.p1  ORF type:complete len:787 (-),score=133.41 NODE_198_length_2799_cov_16.376727_g181_i0:217-2577(-)
MSASERELREARQRDLDARIDCVLARCYAAQRECEIQSAKMWPDDSPSRGDAFGADHFSLITPSSKHPPGMMPCALQPPAFHDDGLPSHFFASTRRPLTFSDVEPSEFTSPRSPCFSTASGLSPRFQSSLRGPMRVERDSECHGLASSSDSSSLNSLNAAQQVHVKSSISLPSEHPQYAIQDPVASLCNRASPSSKPEALRSHLSASSMNVGLDPITRPRPVSPLVIHECNSPSAGCAEGGSPTNGFIDSMLSTATQQSGAVATSSLIRVCELLKQSQRFSDASLTALGSMLEAPGPSRASTGCQTEDGSPITEGSSIGSNAHRAALTQMKQSANDLKEQLSSLRELAVSGLSEAVLLPIAQASATLLSPKQRQPVLELAGAETSALEAELRRMTLLYRMEAKERSRLHDQLHELRGNVRVVVRLRPRLRFISSAARTRRSVAVTAALSTPSTTQVRVVLPSDSLTGQPRPAHSFSFDRVLDARASQDEIFTEVHPLVISVVDGKNGCVMAYGQTGSGKTYTMLGGEDGNGILMNALQLIWTRKCARENAGGLIVCRYSIRLAMMEVYNESIHDLLVPCDELRDQRLDVRLTSSGEVSVPDLYELEIDSAVSDFMPIISRALNSRRVGASHGNRCSSRSHCVIRIQVECANAATGDHSRGTLFLVDLAGSERIRTPPSPECGTMPSFGLSGGNQLIKETQCINKSLLALGDVMEALAIEQHHVPFRNSKLTFLLQDALAKGSKVLVVLTIIPSDDCVHETLSSLNFAARISRGGAKKTTSRSLSVK